MRIKCQLGVRLADDCICHQAAGLFLFSEMKLNPKVVQAGLALLPPTRWFGVCGKLWCILSSGKMTDGRTILELGEGTASGEEWKQNNSNYRSRAEVESHFSTKIRMHDTRGRALEAVRLRAAKGGVDIESCFNSAGNIGEVFTHKYRIDCRTQCLELCFGLASSGRYTSDKALDKTRS